MFKHKPWRPFLTTERQYTNTFIQNTVRTLSTNIKPTINSVNHPASQSVPLTQRPVLVGTLAKFELY